MKLYTIAHVTVNSETREFEYKNFPSDRYVDEMLEACEKVHPEWTSMVVTLVRARKD
jgi:hypothetical protein